MWADKSQDADHLSIGSQKEEAEIFLVYLVQRAN